MSKANKLIKRQDLENVLRKDRGTFAKLVSFNIKNDVTTKGDNYACAMAGIEVNYTEYGKEKKTSYVAKMYPCFDNSSAMDDFIQLGIQKEIGFYSDIVPLLNMELSNASEAVLNVPKYYHSVKIEKEQVIYLEDLRQSKFKMADRRVGLDKNHAILVIKELAKLHASSALLMSKEEFNYTKMIDNFSSLKDMYHSFFESKVSKNTFDRVLSRCAKLIENNEDYKYAADFIKSKIGMTEELMRDLLRVSSPFISICHGDCWTNNFMFRYNKRGLPEDCKFLDFQVTRIGSPALDLNYLFFSSFNGDVRRENLDDFLLCYYSSFASIMAASRMPVPFTYGNFLKEFKIKNMFGLITGLLLIPVTLVDPRDAPSFEDVKTEDLEESRKIYGEKLLECMSKSGLLKSKFLSVFDDLNDAGLFKERSVFVLVNNFNALNN